MKTLILILLFAVQTFGQSSLILLMSDDILVETKAYQTRVLADGGIVVDLEAVNSAYKSIKSANIMDSLWGFWDANFGVKKDANNKVTKLYNLIGSSDLVQTDTSLSPIWYADSLEGKATMKFSSKRLLSSIIPNQTYGWSFYTVAQIQTANNPTILGETGNGTNYNFYLFNGIGLNMLYGGSTNGTNALRSGSTRAIYTNNIIGASIDPSDGNRARNYSNGSSVATAQLSSPILTYNNVNFIVGMVRTVTVLNPFIGNISSLIMSKDVIAEPVWLNQYYKVY